MAAIYDMPALQAIVSKAKNVCYKCSNYMFLAAVELLQVDQRENKSLADRATQVFANIIIENDFFLLKRS